MNQVAPIPSQMLAAVYEAPGRVAVRSVPVPEIRAGELLVRVESCGICGTDLKKITKGLQPPLRIYGHEFAGTVVATGKDAPSQVGRRVAVYHHVPCRSCYFCRNGAYTQCQQYKKTGTTAGFAPAGGGWAQYVRVMDWIARDGVVEVPPSVSFDQASLMEPLNTCLKCVDTVAPRADETIVVFGQGAIGLILTRLCALRGARVVGVDLMESRLDRSSRFGACCAVNPAAADLRERVGSLTAGRGADAAFVAAPSAKAVEDAINITRPAGRIMLFAQTEKQQEMLLPVGQICVLEKFILGSYSSSIDLNEKVSELLFSNEVRANELITHRFPITEIQSAIQSALDPGDDTLKILVKPNEE